jgi:hypothetical protein
LCCRRPLSGPLHACAEDVCAGVRKGRGCSVVVAGSRALAVAGVCPGGGELERGILKAGDRGADRWRRGRGGGGWSGCWGWGGCWD